MSSEFLDMGKRETALEVLFEAIRVRRGKLWSKSVEEAMVAFCGICLSMRNFQAFKDGVSQFRILCQTSNVTSFETVIGNFFDTCVEETSKCQTLSRERVVASDLDFTETPETIILKSISETTSQDRADRLLLNPALRFTWEVFRNILDALKNNKNFEKAYAETCTRAFKFVIKFERKTEFRKLCDVTRNHLALINKFNQYVQSINLLEPTSQEIQLNIRLSQLDTALTLELWTEAFKTMEDIHCILRMCRKPPHPKILAIYYQKISIVFSKSNSPIFHSCALYKLFLLIKEHKKNYKPNELSSIATKVLASALSIPLNSDNDFYSMNSEFFVNYNIYNTASSGSSISLQLASVLGLTCVPTRMSILEDIVKSNIVQYADPAIISIFKTLTENCFSSDFCRKITKSLDSVSDSLKDDVQPYIEAIKSVSFIHLLKFYSKFYKNISLEKLAKSSPGYDKSQVFELLLEYYHQGVLSLTYDDINDSIVFGGFSSVVKLNSVWDSKLIDSLISKADNVNDLYGNRGSLSKSCQEYQNKLYDEFYRFANVQKDIARQAEKRTQENAELSKLKAIKLEEERVRLENLKLQNKEDERKKREDAQNNDLNSQKSGSLYENKEIYGKGGKKKDGAENLDDSALAKISAQNEQRDKEINQHVRRIKRFKKNWDILVYSVTKAETPLIEKYIEESRNDRTAAWNVREENRILMRKKAYEFELGVIKRLEDAESDINEFLKSSEEKMRSIHEQNMTAYEDMIQKERETVFEQKKREYIQKKKEEHVNKRKIQFEKRKAPQSNFGFGDKSNLSNYLLTIDNPLPPVKPLPSSEAQKTAYFSGAYKSHSGDAAKPWVPPSNINKVLDAQKSSPGSTSDNKQPVDSPKPSAKAYQPPPRDQSRKVFSSASNSSKIPASDSQKPFIPSNNTNKTPSVNVQKPTPVSDNSSKSIDDSQKASGKTEAFKPNRVTKKFF